MSGDDRQQLPGRAVQRYQVSGAASPAALPSRQLASPARMTDREFLPAALEIVATPPSPATSIFAMTLCAILFCALAWSYFTWIDIYVVAPGKVLPGERSKVVQSLDAGRIATLAVRNGTAVSVGDRLLELDRTEAAAEREAVARDLEAASAEATRRRIAVTIASGTEPHGTILYDTVVDDTMQRREDAVLHADLAELQAHVDSLSAQIDEKHAARQRLIESIETRARLVAITRERVAMRREIQAKGAGSRALTLEAMQQLEAQLSAEVGERGQLKETEASLVSLKRRIDESVTQFVAEQRQKGAEAERRRDRLAQELVKARARTERMVITAPVAGIVQQLAVTTIGQVVSSGQPLMTIVPLDGGIEVEAQILNKDVGFVEPGLAAAVKVDAYPFTRYGAISGTVKQISQEAVDDREASRLSDVTGIAHGPPGSSIPAQSINLVFPATINLARQSLTIDGREMRLAPGMTVIVEIKTGKRRVIDYLLSPIRETAAQSGHER